MKSINFLTALSLAAVLFSSCAKDEDNSVSENFNSLTLAANSYWNGSDNSGSFKVNGITFPNSYSVYQGKGYWNGFAYSNQHDVKTAGFGNQYSSYVLKDTASTNTFVVAYPYYSTNTVEFDNVIYDLRCKIANNTYTALSMKLGDGMAKKFGGTSGNDQDWLKLRIIGINEAGTPTDSVDFYLADYRPADNKQDYILNEWKSVNLDKLGKIKKLKFELSSSDNNEWGMLTPGYFCLDNMEYKPVAKTE